MDDLLRRENAAHRNVFQHLKDPRIPIGSVVAAFTDYRILCQAVIFADIVTYGDVKGEELWHAHIAGKQYLSKFLKLTREKEGDNRVAIRGVIEHYMKWIKASTSFYREHVYKLSVTFGLPELQAIAAAVQTPDMAVLASPGAQSVNPEVRALLVSSCHKCLISLGDLARYRAHDNLDKKQDFGPAVGFYALSTRLCPDSGVGYNQQAVVALEQKEHLRAMYHLFRAICVLEPHPSAPNNLKTEFKSILRAWDRQDLIPRARPNDPDAPKKALVGWYVRLQSICYKGELSKGFDELELEVLSQLTLHLKQRDLDTALSRMVLVNVAAQHLAIATFTNEPTVAEHEQTFFYSMRVNLRFYTTLLSIFQDDLLKVARNSETRDAELSERVLPASSRVLPALRMYSAWLLRNVHLLFGLKSDNTLSGHIEAFWKMYGRTLDLVCINFPIWDLEEVAAPEYVLEDDVDIIGFQPLTELTAIAQSQNVGNSFWQKKRSAFTKPYFNDPAVQRLSAAEESLARIFGFLEDGLYIANDLAESPIEIKGERVFYGNDGELEQLIMPAALEKTPPKQTAVPVTAAAKPMPPRPAAPAKPLSYAAAAANSPKHAPKAAQKPIARPTGPPALTTAPSQHVQEEQLSRMVDDLLDEDETKDPVTPPQQLISDPAIVHTNGDFGTPDYGVNSATESGKTPVTRAHMKSPSIASLWPTSPPAAMTSNTSPKYPSGLPVGTLSSPAPQARGHSRVGSANSVRSRTSQNVGDSWSSMESLPQGTGMGRNAEPLPGLGGYGESALLFGAGGSMWSAGGGIGGNRRSFGAAGAASPGVRFGG